MFHRALVSLLSTVLNLAIGVIMKFELDNTETFLIKNRISKDDWDKANISMDELNSIAEDYANQIPHLNEAAEFLAKVLQKCPQVHSVRWRVKDTAHLLVKIIRKRASGSDKYRQVSARDYSQIVTDLVGVRVLHLFKYEWLDIHSYILNCWAPVEKVKAYIREGDEGGIIDSYRENGCDVEPHLSGYRSIHYIISTQPTLKRILSEIQVRTIFEEGWSEIDHKVRYPNFSDSKLISYFLTIFNRLAGSADEMGTFVKDLTAEISLQQLKYEEVKRNEEEHFSKIEALALGLSKEKVQNENMADNLKKLNAEINELRTNARRSEKYVNLDIPGLSGPDMEALRNATYSALARINKDISFGSSVSSLSGLNKDGLLRSSVSTLAGLDKDSLLGSSAAALTSIDRENWLGSSTATITNFDSKNLLGAAISTLSQPNLENPPIVGGSVDKTNDEPNGNK